MDCPEPKFRGPEGGDQSCLPAAVPRQPAADPAANPNELSADLPAVTRRLTNNEPFVLATELSPHSIVILVSAMVDPCTAPAFLDVY